jgi:alpha-amylase
VLNHDTQTRYERDHSVIAMSPWFIPLANAFILLRADSVLPCVFYGDLYGIGGEHPLPPSGGGNLPKLILARKLLAYGPMREYLDEANCIGFTRSGDRRHPEGLAVVMGNAGWVCWKRMNVGMAHKDEVWTDMLRAAAGEVVIGRNGNGMFSCAPGSVSVWCRHDSLARARIDNMKL